ncbi:Plasma membrane permease, mediates uptake of glycerophosphoinositol and glycerophosphocholine [Agyrium rufum]|nr:Plasma membrane permease, mediates uptake of glycerophosphoinositol and glycerophosphocholine [Agyrium rufum]
MASVQHEISDSDSKELGPATSYEKGFASNVTPGAPGAVVVAEDPAAPSQQVSSGRQSLSDVFTIFCAGFALISDGYQNNLMTMTNVLFRQEYKKEYTSAVSTQVSNALLVGEILGQIVIGLTCDYLGRKTAIIITTLMIVIGGILATAAHGITILGMFWMITIARGVVGFGTGGEYPASSTSASEAANEHALKRRGPIFILVTNLPLSFGGPLAVIVFLIVLKICSEQHLSTVWRVCFGIGCLLPLTVFYFRIKMLNSKLYRRGAIKRRVPYKLVIRYYWKSLIGTCGAWFLYDFVTFPNGVFSGTIISSIVKDNSLLKTAEYQLLLGSIALPGVFLGAYLCDILGRKNTMMLGFSGYLVFGLIIGCSYDKITKILPLFVIFYGLMQSSGNLGPGDMLGLLSSESYATAVRGTCYGISAALGKTGAAVGTEVFTPIQNHLGKRWTFIIAAICGVAGILVTFFFVKDVRGDDLANEDEAFRAFLVKNGWEGEMGEEDLRAFAKEGIPGGVSTDTDGYGRREDEGLELGSGSGDEEKKGL